MEFEAVKFQTAVAFVVVVAAAAAAVVVVVLFFVLFFEFCFTHHFAENDTPSDMAYYEWCCYRKKNHKSQV